MTGGHFYSQVRRTFDPLVLLLRSCFKILAATKITTSITRTVFLSKIIIARTVNTAPVPSVLYTVNLFAF